MPMWIVEKWCREYGYDITKKMLVALLQKRPTTIRCNLSRVSAEELKERLEKEGVTVTQSPYLNYAFAIEHYDYLGALETFQQGLFQVQDVSSMLIGEIARTKNTGIKVIDVCAAPGGKALHLADRLAGTGTVEARDLTEAKVTLIRSNIDRCGMHNIVAVQKDALVFDEASVEQADILIVDVPCSGLGVLSRKSDIKYRMSAAQQEELVKLQRAILETVCSYVKIGGVLIYSTCTINQEENADNLNWFVNNYPYRPDSIEQYLPKELRTADTPNGFLQLLPGIHDTDGFFMARLIREA